MAKCSFCSQSIEPGTGFTVIRSDGKMFRFDRKKCEVSMLEFGKDSRDTKWITKAKQ